MQRTWKCEEWTQREEWAFTKCIWLKRPWKKVWLLPSRSRIALLLPNDALHIEVESYFCQKCSVVYFVAILCLVAILPSLIGYFGYFGYFFVFEDILYFVAILYLMAILATLATFVFEAVLYFVAILATFSLNATVCNAMHRVVRTTWKLQFFRWIARVPKWSNSDTTMRILTTPFTDYKKIEFCLKPLLLVFECDGCFNCSTSIVMNDLSRRADWSIVEAAKSNYLTETFSSWHDLCFPSTTTLPQLNLMKATANYLNIRFDHKLLTPLTTNFKFFCLLQDFGP